MVVVKLLYGQELLKRMDPGVDWGAKRRVVIRTADNQVQLFIRAGHRASTGAHGFGQTYHPNTLILHAKRGGGYGRVQHLAEGRITRQTLLDHQGAITAAFGTTAWMASVHPSRTLVIAR